MLVENNLIDYNKQDIIALTNTVLSNVDFKEINIQSLFDLLTVVEVNKPKCMPEIFTKAIDVLDKVKISRKGKVRVLVNTPEERIKKIKELSNLDHLNEDELKIVENIINEFHDCFHIPGDYLPCTDIYQHRMITTNE